MPDDDHDDILKEQNLRKNAFENDTLGTNDKIYRAWGIISQARLISSEELLNLLSLIRLGTSLGILKTNFGILNSLLFESGAFELCLKYGGTPDARKRDELRANLVRGKLSTLV